MVKEMVEAKVEFALSNTEGKKQNLGTNYPARNYVKKVIHNPKSPSDTTIYALALNLTPEKNVNNNKSPPIYLL